MVLLVFPSALYKQTKVLDLPAAERAFKQRFTALWNEHRRDPLTLREKIRELLHTETEAFKNAALYDASGTELHLYSPFSTISNGTRLHMPIISYRKEDGFTKFEGVHDEQRLSLAHSSGLERALAFAPQPA